MHHQYLHIELNGILKFQPLSQSCTFWFLGSFKLKPPKHLSWTQMKHITQEHSQGHVFLSYVPWPICWVTCSQQFHNHIMHTPQQEAYEALRRIQNSEAASMGGGFQEEPWDFRHGKAFKCPPENPRPWRFLWEKEAWGCNGKPWTVCRVKAALRLR